MNRQAEFDKYADTYDAVLAESLSVSGEDKEYFASGRITLLTKRLQSIQEQPRAIMDYGCGTGSSVPLLLEMLGAESAIGIETSAELLNLATKNYRDPRVSFLLTTDYRPEGAMDLVFSNGTFHHILPDDRPAALSLIHGSLKPNGLFALWENNPWNPLTRYLMSRCAFDEDAVTLSPPEARRLVQEHGFEVLSTEFAFIFPKSLRWFRSLEPFAASLPFGAQYQVLCRKRSVTDVS